ncbi:MAG: hypothetical protein D6766_01545 [Verrucomicrobia bacterium]|nr:MAG: hypothetical protein D6766_01545 [Verrucomicrobiota bacterium]
MNAKASLPAALWLAVSLAVLAPSGCMPPPSVPRYAIPPIGARCTIQFRRDALGAAAKLPVPPRADSINGAETSITGRLKQFTTDWIVLDVGGKEVWIAKSVVLLIEVEPPPGKDRSE